MAENPRFLCQILDVFFLGRRTLSGASEQGPGMDFITYITMKTNQILSIYSLDPMAKV